MMRQFSLTSRQCTLIGAWILIGFQFLALMGFITDGQKREVAMGTFMLKYSATTAAMIAGAFDYFIASNVLPVAAMVAGWVLWSRYHCSQGRTIIGTGAIAIITGSMLIF